MSETPDPDIARQAAAELARRTGVERHDVALVLGSGWTPAVDALGAPEHELAFTDLPGFLPPVVSGHAGRVRSVNGYGSRPPPAAGSPC